MTLLNCYCLSDFGFNVIVVNDNAQYLQNQINQHYYSFAAKNQEIYDNRGAKQKTSCYMLRRISVF